MTRNRYRRNVRRNRAAMLHTEAVWRQFIHERLHTPRPVRDLP